MQNCRVCKRTFVYKRGYNSHTRCASCAANERRHEKKKKAIEYKGGKCAICGYNKCHNSLSFHHLDPSQKDFEFSGNHCRKWETLRLELDKCLLLCLNCHGEIHAEINKNKKL